MTDPAPKSPRGDRPPRRDAPPRRAFPRAVEVTRISLRGLAQSFIPRMAAALAYRTIFSLVPVLFVGVAVIGSFVTDEQLEIQVARLLDAAGLSEISVDPTIADPGANPAADPAAKPAAKPPVRTPGEPPENPSTDPATGPATDAATNDATEPARERAARPGPEDRAPLAATPPAGEPDRLSLEQWITGLVERVQRIRLDAIGLAGFALLIWAAISMLVELERSFDSICGVRTNRTWARRITTYWTVITLGLVLLLATFRGGQEVGAWVTQHLASGDGPGWLGRFVERAINLLINISLLALAYITVPSTRIRIGPALVGAVVAGTLWEIAKGLFTLYLVGGGLERLYGVVALLPLFLLWVYVTWCVVLVGLQIAYAMQHFDVWVQRIARDDGDPAASVVDPAAVLRVGGLLVRRFRAGRHLTAAEAADALGIPEQVARTMLANLADTRIAHRVEDDDNGDEDAYVLAAPPDEISAVRVLLAGESLASGSASETDAVMDELARQRRESLTGRTLADLAGLAPNPQPAPPQSARPADAGP